MSGLIHNWFGLTYSSYLVVPRVALQHMPEEWQKDFVTLMEEFEATGLETPSYHVLRDDPKYTSVTLEDSEDENSRPREFYLLQSDPWANYRRPDAELLRVERD